MKTLILTAMIMASGLASAATVEIWEGAGNAYDVSGKTDGAYSLVVKNTKDGNQIDSEVTVTLANGSRVLRQCKMTDNGPTSWTTRCDFGQGGGHCFNDGMCISYEEDAAGNAFATTIAIDSPTQMRLLRTQLKNGKAEAFFQEKLHKR